MRFGILLFTNTFDKTEQINIKYIHVYFVRRAPLSLSLCVYCE